MLLHRVGRRFHISLRFLDFTSGPLGLGFRLFFWKSEPDFWIANVDILTPIFDLQFGLHRKDGLELVGRHPNADPRLLDREQ